MNRKFFLNVFETGDNNKPKPLINNFTLNYGIIPKLDDYNLTVSQFHLNIDNLSGLAIKPYKVAISASIPVAQDLFVEGSLGTGTLIQNNFIYEYFIRSTDWKQSLLEVHDEPSVQNFRQITAHSPLLEIYIEIMFFDLHQNRINLELQQGDFYNVKFLFKPNL